MGHYDDCYDREEERYHERMRAEGKIRVPYRIAQFLYHPAGRPIEYIDPEDLKALREFLGNCALCRATEEHKE